MLTKEQNERLTRVGKGTPGGEFLRRYWHPVALAKEMPLGGKPLPVKILGEELVLYRDDQGQLGLLGRHCPHRCTDLSYGRVEHGGLRCVYHGWLFNTEGKCIEQPGEQPGSTFKDKIKHKAYPIREAAGMIFAYLGDGQPPLLPAYEFLTAAPEYVHAGKLYSDCNFLQGNEGNIDPVHLSYLHAAGVPNNPSDTERFFGADTAPLIEVERVDFGVRIHAVRNIGDGKRYLRNTYFIMPNLSAFTGISDDGYMVNWHVPIDDTSHWKYMIGFTRKAPINKEKWEYDLFGNEVTEDYRPIRTRENGYLQNRGIMDWNYCGIGERPGCCFPSHDLLATETQGYIQDRTQEHLGPTDLAIATARRMMLQGIEAVENGQDPLHVVKDEADNIFCHLMVVSSVIDEQEDWKTFWKKRTAEIHGVSI